MTQKTNIKVVIAAQVGIFFFGVVFFVLGTILNALGLRLFCPYPGFLCDFTRNRAN